MFLKSLAPAQVASILLTLMPSTWALIVLIGRVIVGQAVGPEAVAIGALVLLGFASLATTLARPEWCFVPTRSYYGGLCCGLILYLLISDARSAPAWSLLILAALGTLVAISPDGMGGAATAAPMPRQARATRHPAGIRMP